LFGKIRSAFKKAAESLRKTVGEVAAYKTLREGDVAPILDELLIDLVEADVAYETAEKIISGLREKLVGLRVRRGDDVEKVVRDTLRDTLLSILSADTPDFPELAKRACSLQKPLVILFLGVNGSGKTTTIAKVAWMLKKSGVTPVVAAADTFRAGAQEQLAAHAEKVGVPIIKGRYGADPASVAYDAVNYAKARGFCAVLVDTAGRMHVDEDLMQELKKIVRVVQPDIKVLVVDSLTGNDAVEQATRFHEAVSIDAVIVTKVDADPKGGTVVSVADAIRRPIAYLGVGQRYEDLKRFSPQEIVDKILQG